ncbi:MAPEG family protein [Sphingomonas sp. BT-65]|uniref:MAPEG family protein n=1 Tax=Sphingomonas sp. BT-65 TaxID=2989821 RepID=UPI0022354BE0|nr:MAPEG family protein [Sphingomonas sp. BT-65]MCW4463649.1 MAPEG family protein [Sphingomonas sp. BT-65]
MTFHVTALYASLVALGVIVLANIVSARRGRARISILHGDDLGLALAIRRHGNLIENAPLMLILMGLCEASDLAAPWLHAMGILFLAARVAHVAGLSVERLMAPLRLVGGIGTQIAMLGAVGYLLWRQF